MKFQTIRELAKIVMLALLATGTIVSSSLAGRGDPVNGPVFSGSTVPTSLTGLLVSPTEVEKVTKICMIEAAGHISRQVYGVDLSEEGSGIYFFNNDHGDNPLESFSSSINILNTVWVKLNGGKDKNMQEIRVTIAVPEEDGSLPYSVSEYIELSVKTYTCQEPSQCGESSDYGFNIPYVSYDRDIVVVEYDYLGRPVKKIDSIAKLELNNAEILKERVYLENKGHKTKIHFDLAAYKNCLIEEINNPVAEDNK